MVKKKKTKKTRVVQKIGKAQIILKVFCYTPIAKPLNGSLRKSNASHMLKLDSIPYIHDGKGAKEKSESFAILYMLKGIKGVLRRKIALICFEKGLEVCHSTDKETDKHGNKLLPEGFHQLGSCIDNRECILHQIFGSKGNKGIISVSADPICSISHKTAEIPESVQKVHIASDNRINLTYNGKSIQNFNERYFSGYFTFEADLSQCSPEQMGLIIESAMNFDRLGRGYNSGYGHIEVKKLLLLRRTISMNPLLAGDGSFIIQKEIDEKPLEKLFQQSLEAWRNGTAA
ncbi:MAG: hypothetical protein ACXADY_05600 [Candidatus Hodarchaeales archaeon]|jgi:hypothetical protein